MNIDEDRPNGNAAASAPREPQSLEKAHKQRSTNEKSRNRRTRGSPAVNRSLTAQAGLPVTAGNGRPKSNGREQISAAAVDAAANSAAQAADTPAASLPRQASTDHAAYAEVALTLNGGKRPGQTEVMSRASGTQLRTSLAGPRVSGDDKGSAKTPKERLPGGDAPLPDDIADFVDEVHSRVDLFEVLADLLNSEDEKIQQRALERILEMKYKHAASGDDPVQIILDGPRPQRD
jgi:hypothetical protein